MLGLVRENDNAGAGATMRPDEAADLVGFVGDGPLDLGITQLDAATAEELAQCGGRLYLNDLTEIDVPTAVALSKVKNSLHLNGLKRISPAVAEALSHFSGLWLCLDGLTEIDPAVAESLSHFSGLWLSLNGLTHIDPAVAEQLVKIKSSLRLDGISELDLPLAETLSHMKGGFETLNTPPDFDKHPVPGLPRSWDIPSLSLGGIEGLDREVASTLGKIERNLVLRGGKDFDPEVLRELTRYHLNPKDRPCFRFEPGWRSQVKLTLAEGGA